MILPTVDKICVRLCDEDGNYKFSYYTSALSETLKMYEYMAQSNISLWVKDVKENEYECSIKDLDVRFANDENLFSITLYCFIMNWGDEKE